MTSADKNQGMAFRLAAAVADDSSQVLPSEAIVAAGLFAIASSLDRFTDVLEREFMAYRPARRKAKS